MRLKRKAISLNLNVYDGLNELRKRNKCSFNQLIEKYVPMPFFIAPLTTAQPVVKIKKRMKIPKKKYNYHDDLDDFMKNRCKSLSLKPMDPNKKVKAVNGEYPPETAAMIAEVEAGQPWRKKYAKKKAD